MFTIILQAPTEVRRYHGNGLVDVARKSLNAGEYRAMPPIPLTSIGGVGNEGIAEELFDLTNNPSRQEEREQLYGRHRSMSVGDIVVVNGHLYLCSWGCGWTEMM